MKTFDHMNFNCLLCDEEDDVMMLVIEREFERIHGIGGSTGVMANTEFMLIEGNGTVSKTTEDYVMTYMD